MMIGHKQIIDWRKAGKKPSSIFFEVGIVPVIRSRFDDPEKALDYGLYPTVYVLPGEMGKHLDLRFCIGCRVHVHAKTPTDDVLNIAQAISDAKASHVILCCDTQETIEWEKGEIHAYVDA